MTEFTDEILADEAFDAIITASGIEILIESVPSGNLKLALVSGNPVVSERGDAARIYNTGQIEVHNDGGFLVMSGSYEAGDPFAASTANGTAVYRVPNYDGVEFNRADNVYVELRKPDEPFESTENPYYLLTNTPSASTRFLGRAEQPCVNGVREVCVRTMSPKFDDLATPSNPLVDVVRVRLTDSDFLQLLEVEVVERDTSVALAVNGTATQSSDYQTANTSADNAIDGDTATGYPDSLAMTQNEHGAWWEVDLGGSYDIETIVIYNRHVAGGRLEDAVVEAIDSDGNIVWDTIITGTSDGSIHAFTVSYE